MKRLFACATVYIIGCAPVPPIVSPQTQEMISHPPPQSAPQMNCASGTLLNSDFDRIDELFHATFDERCSSRETAFHQSVTEVTCSESVTCAQAVCQCEITFTPSACGGTGIDTKIIRTADFAKKDDVWRIHPRPLD